MTENEFNKELLNNSSMYTKSKVYIDDLYGSDSRYNKARARLGKHIMDNAEHPTVGHLQRVLEEIKLDQLRDSALRNHPRREDGAYWSYEPVDATQIYPDGPKYVPWSGLHHALWGTGGGTVGASIGSIVAPLVFRNNGILGQLAKGIGAGAALGTLAGLGKSYYDVKRSESYYPKKFRDMNNLQGRYMKFKDDTTPDYEWLRQQIGE